MKVILFGATGMVGQGVLRDCLLDPDVEIVLAIVRKTSLPQHAKLREIVHQDVADLSAIDIRPYGVSGSNLSQAQPDDDLHLCIGSGNRQHRAWQTDVGAGKRQNRKRALADAI